MKYNVINIINKDLKTSLLKKIINIKISKIIEIIEFNHE